MRGATPPTPRFVLMAWYLVKHKGNFTSFTKLEVNVFLHFSVSYPK